MAADHKNVTKVLLALRNFVIAAAMCAGPCASPALSALDVEAESARPAEKLYLSLGHVGLDPTRVFRVRGASLERSGVHITLEDGTLAFTEDVMGRITGAFFEGDGEVLLLPPNEVERESMSLFTGMAILEARFATAYFRFNDQTEEELRPDLRAADDAQGFVSRWGDTARNLAQQDATRLLITFSKLLAEANAGSTPDNAAKAHLPDPADRVLHARLQSTELGVFDVYFDSMAAEQIQAGQIKSVAGEEYYDVWTSFSPGDSHFAELASRKHPSSEDQRADAAVVRRYQIVTDVKPPKEIDSEARLQVEFEESGMRTVIFELSRFLQVKSVEMDGQPLEFIHNPSLEGTQLSRSGNDLVAVILPNATKAGQNAELRFVYGGDVLAEAGSGLLYVGARGIWYPNRGLAMADYDLEFHYPPGWTLIATGKAQPVSDAPASSSGQSGHWVSERPIPVAGFNLGKYRTAMAKAGEVSVETYAAGGVERDFPIPPSRVVENNSSDPASRRRGLQVITPAPPSPARNLTTVAEMAARAIHYYADRFGPFPYSHLALTQMPGRDSQGWPGLIFLSSYAFLNDADRAELHFDPVRILLQQQIPAHETAHQWWGDLISWNTYRDQWLSEGLANYCSLMMLEEKNPAGFREIMEDYRLALVRKNKDGVSPRDAGPVTLGVRLLSSHFPQGYEAISYGRGSWIFHMLRTMLRDAEAQDPSHKATNGAGEEPFVRSLLKVRQRYEGRSISTQELLGVFAEDLPPSLRYEGKKSLQWFLDSWVNGTALPRLELKNVAFTRKESAVTVSGTILQREAPDDLVTSVPVYAVFASKQPLLLGRVLADGKESSFRLAAPAGTRKIVLDPYETVLTAPK